MSRYDYNNNDDDKFKCNKYDFIGVILIMFMLMIFSCSN